MAAGLLLPPGKIIPKPRLRLVEGAWWCSADAAEGEYPTRYMAIDSTPRDAYAGWLDANALVHVGFKRYDPDVRPFQRRP